MSITLYGNHSKSTTRHLSLEITPPDTYGERTWSFFYLSDANRHSIYLPPRDRKLSWPGYLLQRC